MSKEEEQEHKKICTKELVISKKETVTLEKVFNEFTKKQQKSVYVIVGSKNSGKKSVAQIMIKDMGFVEIKFNEMTPKIFDTVFEDSCEYLTTKENGIRRLDSCIRNEFGSAVFCRMLINRVRKSKADKFVITGVWRFDDLNILANDSNLPNFKIVRIVRPYNFVFERFIEKEKEEAERENRKFEMPQEEIALSEFKHYHKHLNNVGTLDDLKFSVEKLINKEND